MRLPFPVWLRITCESFRQLFCPIRIPAKHSPEEMPLVSADKRKQHGEPQHFRWTPDDIDRSYLSQNSEEAITQVESKELRKKPSLFASPAQPSVGNSMSVESLSPKI